MWDVRWHSYFLAVILYVYGFIIYPPPECSEFMMLPREVLSFLFHPTPYGKLSYFGAVGVVEKCSLKFIKIWQYVACVRWMTNHNFKIF